MDEMDSELLSLRNFILLGGYFIVFYVYLVCMVCCRVEC